MRASSRRRVRPLRPRSQAARGIHRTPCDEYTGRELSVPTLPREGFAISSWRCGALIAAIVSATSPTASAQGIGVVVAGPRGGDERAALTAALTETLSREARGRVVGDALGEARAQLAAGAVPVATLARFRRVRETIDLGWRAYLRAQIDFAQSRLAAARTDAEALVALPGGAELYADAALRLGAVLLHRRIADAPAVLALAIALDPARPITLAEFSPDVVEAVDAVRAAPAALQRVHLATVPAGAMISIDGVALGPSPLDAQVTRGQHLVVARAPGFRAAVQGVLAEGGPAAVELALDRDDDAILLAAGGELGGNVLGGHGEQPLIEAALELADLDEVVIAAIGERHGGPAVILQRCAGAPARCTAVVEVGFLDRAGLPGAVREAWRVALRGALRGAPIVIRDSARAAPAPRCRLCRSPLVWTGVGAVVVGVVVAILAHAGGKSPPLVTVNGSDFGR